MKIRCYDIEWDTDGEITDLPTDTVVEVDDDLDVGEEIADVLSDKFGFCVFGCSVEHVA